MYSVPRFLQRILFSWKTSTYSKNKYLSLTFFSSFFGTIWDDSVRFGMCVADDLSFNSKNQPKTILSLHTRKKLSTRPDK